MKYFLIEEDGATELNMDLALPLKSVFLNRYGLFKVKQYSKDNTLVVCKQILDNRYFDFFELLNSMFHVSLTKDGFIRVDSFNGAFDYNLWLLNDGEWNEEQPVYGFLKQFTILRHKLYFEWVNPETLLICYNK